MKLSWTEPAQENLREIHKATMCRESLEAADKTIDRIIARAEHLLQFPESGHRLENPKYAEERQVISYPYRIIYRIRADEVEILNVFHGARNRP